MSSNRREERKEKVKKILEVKFRSKTNIAKAKADLSMNLALLHTEMRKSRQAQVKLKKELRKEEQELALRLRESKLDERKNVLEQKKLIRDNKDLLKKQLTNLKQEIRNQKQENKNEEIKIQSSFNKDKNKLRKEYIIARSNIKTDIDKLKRDYEKEKIELRTSIAKANQENAKLKIENLKIINEKKNDINKMKLELKEKRARAVENAKRIKTEKLLTSARIKKDLTEEKLKQERLAQEEIANIKLKKQRDIDAIKMNLIQSDIDVIESENENIETLNKEQRAIAEKQVEIESMKKEFKQKISDSKKETEKLLEVDIEEVSSNEHFEAIRGAVAKKVTKRELKVYERLNTDVSRVSLSKLSMPSDAKEMIKNFRDLKSKDAITDIRDFRDYINFITGEDKSKEDLEVELITPLINMFKGKVFSFLNTYLWVQKRANNKIVSSSQSLIKPKHLLVSLEDTKWNNKYEKVIEEKLKKGLVVKLNENIALMKQDGRVVAITDTPIMR